MAKKEATLTLRIKTLGQEALQSLQENFDVIKTAALGAFTAISAIVIKSVHDYREQEIATQALTQAMVQNGVYSKQLKDDYLAQASAIQKVTLFGDEQVIQAQAAIQMAIGEQKVTKELTLAVADLAQAKGIDLVSAANMVAKTVGSNNNLLSRQGVEFDNNTRGAERLTAVTQALNSKFGGQAEAATGGLGALKQLSNAVSDLAETFGEKLAPSINLVANAFKSMAEDTDNSTPIMDGFIFVLQFVSVLAIELMSTIKGLGAAIGIGLATAVESASLALSGQFSRALDVVKMGFKSIQEEAVRYEQEAQDQIASLVDAGAKAKRDQLAKEEADLAQSLKNKAELKNTATLEDQAKDLENNQIKLDTDLANHQLELATLSGNHAQILAAKIAQQDAILKSNADHLTKLKAQEAKYILEKQQMDDAAHKAKIAALQSVFGQIATLSTSNNSILAGIGKAAALTQIAIATPVAVAEATKWGNAVGGPPLGATFAGLTYASMAAQAAKVAGIPLAEGGIVQPRAGGIQATIGEAGQAEAVIPLDRADEFGLGGGGKSIVINVYGGMLGDERTAQEFASAVDRELLKLQQNGSSVAFGTVS